MENTETYNYSAPVAQLLTLGKPDIDWLDYLAMGFTSEHIPELIRLALNENWIEDEAESDESWTPYHAWRVLGQLRAEAAAEPLLSLYISRPGNEWIIEELPAVYALIGPVALPVLEAFLLDRSHSEDARVQAAISVEKIGQVTPDARTTVIEILSKQIESFNAKDYEFNGFLVDSLVKLKATEAAPLIERAFAANAVDTSIRGDWADIQEELGLLSPEQLEERQQRVEIADRERREGFEKRMLELKSGGEARPSGTYWRQITNTTDFKKAKQKQKRKQSTLARKKNHKH
ncbi:MAG TPA: hypothetical protein VGD98_12700 [Ktedonobacteraceae bacterium]